VLDRLDRLYRLVRKAVIAEPAVPPEPAAPSGPSAPPAPRGRRAVYVRQLGGGLAALHLTGEIDGEVAPRVKERLSSLLEGGATRVLVDCLHVRSFDAEGIGALLAEVPRLREAGGDLILCRVREEIRELLLEQFGLSGVLAFAGTEEDAVTELASASTPDRPLPKQRLWISPVAKSGETVLALRGALDGDAPIRALEEAVANAANAGCPRLVLDLQKLVYVSSGGIGAFIAAHTRCGERRIELRIRGARGVVAMIFSLLGLDAVLPIDR
jgi:anti-anti-sigma factor